MGQWDEESYDNIDTTSFATLRQSFLRDYFNSEATVKQIMRGFRAAALSDRREFTVELNALFSQADEAFVEMVAQTKKDFTCVSSISAKPNGCDSSTTTLVFKLK